MKAKPARRMIVIPEGNLLFAATTTVYATNENAINIG
jgi:hypothetical protein